MTPDASSISSFTDSPETSGDEQEKGFIVENEQEHPLDEFLFKQGLIKDKGQDTVLAGLIKSIFDSKVAEISSIKFEQDIQEILQLRLRQLEITGGKGFGVEVKEDKNIELFQKLGENIKDIYTPNSKQETKNKLRARVNVLYQPFEDLAKERTQSSLLTKDIESKKTEIDGLKSTVEKLRQGKEKNKQQIDSANRRLKASEKQINEKAELQNAQKELQKLRSANQSQIDTSKADVKTLEQSVKSLQTKIAEYKAIYDSVLQDRNDFVKKFKAAEVREAGLRQQLAKQRTAEEEREATSQSKLKKSKEREDDLTQQLDKQILETVQEKGLRDQSEKDKRFLEEQLKNQLIAFTAFLKLKPLIIKDRTQF